MFNFKINGRTDNESIEQQEIFFLIDNRALVKKFLGFYQWTKDEFLNLTMPLKMSLEFHTDVNFHRITKWMNASEK